MEWRNNIVRKKSREPRSTRLPNVEPTTTGWMDLESWLTSQEIFSSLSLDRKMDCNLMVQFFFTSCPSQIQILAWRAIPSHC